MPVRLQETHPIAGDRGQGTTRRSKSDDIHELWKNLPPTSADTLKWSECMFLSLHCKASVLNPMTVEL